MILLRLVSPYIRERSSSILRIHRKKRKRKNVLIPKQQSQQRRHVTITRAKILRASGNVVIRCHCVAFDLSKGLHLFSPLIRGEEEPKILRILHSFLFLFLFFFHEQDESRSKGRIVRASSSIQILSNLSRDVCLCTYPFVYPFHMVY